MNIIKWPKIGVQVLQPCSSVTESVQKVQCAGI